MNNRFTSILNLSQYSDTNDPLMVASVSPMPDKDEQMVLRMLVRAPYSGGGRVQVPDVLMWVMPIIDSAERFQKEVIKVAHPFMYVTIRHGTVSSATDDEWHVDGFSMRYNHLPEANYVVSTGEHPTEFLRQSFIFPLDFDPLQHNVHKFFQRRVQEDAVERMKANTLYFLDPYVVHRRPPISNGSRRTFVRISMTPIEIPDRNNTVNPLIPTAHYVTDGIKDFRNTLVDYDEQKKVLHNLTTT